MSLREGTVEIGDSGSGEAVPSFFSPSFHTSYFPRLLFRLYRCTPQSPFAHHVSLEFTILAILSIGLASIGLRQAWASGSIVWAVLGGAGLVGFVSMLGVNLRENWGRPPSFEAFRLSIFFFLLLLGTSAGFLIGASTSGLWAAFGGLLGLSVGYVLGIVGGLYLQYLGWMAFLFELLAHVGLLALVITDLILGYVYIVAH